MKKQFKKAFAAALVERLWLRGQITTQERDKMQREVAEKLFLRFLAGLSRFFLVSLPLPLKAGAKKFTQVQVPNNRRR